LSLFPVAFYAFFILSEIFLALVEACNSTYVVTDRIVLELSKFEFTNEERQHGIHMILNEFSSQIAQQPIKFTVAGFYVITKTFLSSVREIRESSQFQIEKSLQVVTGIITYLVILMQFYMPKDQEA
jgi:hypothetical protein